MEERKLYNTAHILTLTVNGIAILIGLFITIIYIKCKGLHNYPCYNKLTINLILLVDNILRIIPIGLIEEGEHQFLKNAQGFLLIFLDKFFLIILTNQIVIQYFGIMHTNFYFHNEKKIFAYGTILSAIISISLAGVFISDGVIHKEDKLYCYGNNDVFYKKIIDTVYDGVLLFINVLCLIVIIINSSIYTKKAKISGLENTYYEHNFTQALIKFVVNALTYVISFLIIYRCLSGTGMSDFTYLMNCIIVDVVYCFNKAVIREICKLFCHKKYNEEDTSSEASFDRIGTYGIGEGSGIGEDEDD